MVALLRLLDLGEVRLQILVAQERGPVHTLHRGVPRVALPVGVRRAHQLERLQLAGRRHVRPDAEVDERVLVLDGVAGDVPLAFGLFLDQLHLQRLAARGEERLGFLARPELAFVHQILARQLVHLLLDRLEILRHERTRDDEVVEEAFVGCRTDAALRAGEQVRDRRRQQMRGAVAGEQQRFRTPIGDDPHVGVRSSGYDRSTSVPSTMPASAAFARPGRDGFRHRTDGCAGRELTARPIRQRDGDLAH